MLFWKILEQAQREWAAPIFLAQKNEEKFCFCDDYLKLSTVAKQNLYSVPRMDACIDRLGKDAMFFTLGAKGRYWQVKIDEKDSDKTDINSHHRLYRLLRRQFGLRKFPQHSST